MFTASLRSVPRSVQFWQFYRRLSAGLAQSISISLSSLTVAVYWSTCTDPHLKFGVARKLSVFFSCISCEKHPVCSCILHISAPFSKMATTLVLKVRSLVLELYFDDFHRGCSVAKALLALLASLRLMSASLLSCLSNTAPRLPPTVIRSFFLQFRRMVLVLLWLILRPTALPMS